MHFFGKRDLAQVFYCEYREILKNRFFIEDLFIIIFGNFMFDILELYFTTAKLSDVTERTPRQIDLQGFFSI